MCIRDRDIIKQLANEDLGECLLLPCNLLRSGEDVFLDDTTVGEIETALKVPVQIVDEAGACLLYTSRCV